MGAHDAYTREMDEEEAIAAMEVEAAARRAQGAVPNGHPGGSSSGDGATHPGARRAPVVTRGSFIWPCSGHRQCMCPCQAETLSYLCPMPCMQ